MSVSAAQTRVTKLQRPESTMVIPPGMQVNTGYINSILNKRMPLPPSPQWQRYPPYKVHSATWVCTGMPQRIYLYGGCTFAHPVFTHMPDGVTVGNSGLCNCCVPCLLNAINSLCGFLHVSQELCRVSLKVFLSAAYTQHIEIWLLLTFFTYFWLLAHMQEKVSLC